MPYPYRDDVDALQAKKELLEEDLARIAAQKSALESIARDEKKVAAELDGVRRKLDERRKKLPLLSNVSIATPCNADWGQMAGDERVRFCGSCQKNVYNVSAMKAEEAERLIAEKEGELCVRYHQRADGTILTADCAVGVRKKRVRRTVAGVAFGAGLMSAGALWTTETRQGGMQPTMGEMTVNDVPQVDPPKVDLEEPTPVMGGLMQEAPEPPPHADSPPASNEATRGPAPKKTPSSTSKR
jgi:hypothetical protein